MKKSQPEQTCTKYSPVRTSRPASDSGPHCACLCNGDSRAESCKSRNHSGWPNLDSCR